MPFKEIPKYNKKCKYCQDPFMSYRRTAKFDTNKCRQAWHRENMTLEQLKKEQARSRRSRIKRKRKLKRSWLLQRYKELIHRNNKT